MLSTHAAARRTATRGAVAAVDAVLVTAAQFVASFSTRRNR